MRAHVLLRPGAWILIAVLLGGSALPWGGMGKGSCACGKTQGCCCALSVARTGHGGLAKGSSCSLRGGVAPCTVRSSEGAILRTRTEAPAAKLIARLGEGFLRPPARLALRPGTEKGSRPFGSPLEPPTPPPRSS